MKQYPPALQFAIFIGFFIGFYVLYFIFLITFFPYISGMTIWTLQNSDPSIPKVLGYLKLTQFLYTLVVYLVPALLFARLTESKPAVAIGMQRRPPFVPALLGLGIMLVSLPLVGFIADWNHSWHFSAEARELEKKYEVLTRALLKMSDISTLLLNIVLFAALPAIAEESFFRGVVQKLLVQMVPKKAAWGAVLITAILFSAVHMQWLDFLPRVILGFLLGAIYYLSGNLWLSILGHTLNNGLQVILMYLYQTGITHTDPMTSEPTPWYLAIISLLLTTILIWLFKKCLPKSKEPISEGATS